MVHQRRLILTVEEREALVVHRDHDTHPQVRERCGALLKIADGRSANWVAQNGLLKERPVETVYNWLNIYESEGLVGLTGRLHGGKRRTGL